MASIICFSSDFGLGDTWVGVCHAVMHEICPDAFVVDLGHSVPAFDVRAGAVLAAQGAYQLPNAVHLVVVDPGVGGERGDICIVSAAGTRLVGPDNGVLVPAALRVGGIDAVYALRQDAPDRAAPHPTFHGRDVLAPTAAALACGTHPAELGEPVPAESLAPAPFGAAYTEGDYLVGEVLGADRFGSLRTSITSDDVARHGLSVPSLEITLGHVRLTLPYGRTFGDVEPGDLIALVDSSGWLTLAENQGSALERFGVEPGTHVRVRPTG